MQRRGGEDEQEDGKRHPPMMPCGQMETPGIARRFSPLSVGASPPLPW
jgi:hypothetical protein